MTDKDIVNLSNKLTALESATQSNHEDFLRTLEKMFDEIKEMKTDIKSDFKDLIEKYHETSVDVAKSEEKIKSNQIQTG